MKLTDGQQAPYEPTWRFWLLALLVLPVASVVVYAMFMLASANEPADELSLVAAGTPIMLSALLLTQERAVRCMPVWRRAVWSVVGGLVVAMVDYMIFVAYLYYAISAW